MQPGVRRFYDVMARHDPGLAFLNYGWADADADVVGAPPHPDPDRELADLSAALYRRTLGELAEPNALLERSVVEAGCGRGGGALALVQTGRPRRYTGFDLSPESVRLARRRLGDAGVARFTEAEVAVADVETLPVREGSVDVVLSVEAVHHFPHPRRFFEAVHRALRPDGSFVLAGLFADPAEARASLRGTGFDVEAEDDLTPGVLRSLARTSDRRRERVEALPLPLRFRPFLLSWAGVATEPVFRNFERGALRYVRFGLRRA